MELNKIKRLRGERGFSLRELGEKAGVNYTTISMLENNTRKAQIVTLSKLARALEVPVDDLLEFLDTTAGARGQKGAGVPRPSRQKKATRQIVAA